MDNKRRSARRNNEVGRVAYFRRLMIKVMASHRTNKKPKFLAKERLNHRPSFPLCLDIKRMLDCLRIAECKEVFVLS